MLSLYSIRTLNYKHDQFQAGKKKAISLYSDETSKRRVANGFKDKKRIIAKSTSNINSAAIKVLPKIKAVRQKHQCKKYHDMVPYKSEINVEVER